MFKILEYYGRVEGMRGSLRQLPSWARLILMLVAVPGIVLMGLSILAFLVSLLALLLLTVPVYRVLAAATGSAQAGTPASDAVSADVSPGPRRRHVDVTIIEDPRA